MTTNIDRTPYYIPLKRRYTYLEDEDFVYIMDGKKQIARFSKHISLEALHLEIDKIERKHNQLYLDERRSC